ncbi:MAG: P-II family nitrogen regulator [bacterium]
MKFIKALVRPNMKPFVVDAIEELPDAPGLTVSPVEGWGHPTDGGPHQLTPQVKMEIVVEDERVDEVVDTIVEHGQTGRPGDGKIFISNLERAVKIRTGEEGPEIA